MVVRAPWARAPRSDMQLCSAVDHHPDAARGEVPLQVVGDLGGQPLLSLRAVGVEVHDAGQLGQAEDPVGGQVADVRDARERQHVVLAQRPERDVVDQHQLVVPLGVVEGGEVELGDGEHLRQGQRHPARGGGQVAVEVQAERGEQVAGRCLGGHQVRPGPGPG